MDMDIEKRTLRKISWRIVPFIMILYLIAYIDRVNIGFAAITMKEDLGFTFDSRFWRRNFLFGLFPL